MKGIFVSAFVRLWGIMGIILLSVMSTHTVCAQTLSIERPVTAVQTLCADSFETRINNRPDIQLVDARSAEEFAINHLPGAINIPPGQRIDGLDRKKPILVYAIGNGRSGELSKKLLSRGFPQVYLLDGGIGGWIGHGKPIVSVSKNRYTWDDFVNVLTADNLVLVDLHTRYCPACIRVQPIVDDLARDFGDALKVVRIDVYDNPCVAGRFYVDAIPSLILFHNGTQIYKKTGAEVDRGELWSILTNAVISR